MSTCILYVDESGDPRKCRVPLQGNQTPIFTLTGLALPLRDWRNIDREYLALKNKFFKAEIERSSKRPEHYEVKGNYLSAPRNKDSRRNYYFISQLFELTHHYDGKLFGVTVVKNTQTPTSAKSIITSSLQYMVERFNTYIAEHAEFDKGLIIADSTKRFDFDVASSHMSYIFGSETGRNLTNIYEAPLFADSKLTVGLQLVDNLSSTLYSNHYHYYCRSIEGAQSYEHMQQHWERVKAIQFKSRKQYNGYYIHGFRVIRHDQVST
jgi:hypothetical protein